MSKHTPGDWKIGDPLGEDALMLYVNGVNGEVINIADINHWLSTLGGHTGESEANAALLGTAPKLLAALKEAKRQLAVYSHMPWCSFGEPDCGCACGLKAAIDQAEAAIREAEGED